MTTSTEGMPDPFEQLLRDSETTEANSRWYTEKRKITDALLFDAIQRSDIRTLWHPDPAVAEKNVGEAYERIRAVLEVIAEHTDPSDDEEAVDTQTRIRLLREIEEENAILNTLGVHLIAREWRRDNPESSPEEPDLKKHLMAVFLTHGHEQWLPVIDLLFEGEALDSDNLADEPAYLNTGIRLLGTERSPFYDCVLQLYSDLLANDETDELRLAYLKADAIPYFLLLAEVITDPTQLLAEGNERLIARQQTGQLYPHEVSAFQQFLLRVSERSR